MSEPTPADYRQYASLCDSLAQRAKDQQERRMLLQIGVAWRRLANYKMKATKRREPENSE
jgi:hypothetical protein